MPCVEGEPFVRWLQHGAKFVQATRLAPYFYLIDILRELVAHQCIPFGARHGLLEITNSRDIGVTCQAQPYIEPLIFITFGPDFC